MASSNRALQIRKHKSLKHVLDKWKSDVDGILSIYTGLGEQYLLHRKKCIFFRHAAFKKMVKSAVRSAHELRISDQPRTEATETTDLLQENSSGRRAEVERAPPRAGVLGRLVGHLAEMDETTAELRLERERNMIYETMTDAELEDDRRRLSIKITVLKEQFSKLQNGLQDLQTQYEESKKLCPWPRHKALKSMIKTAISLNIQQHNITV